jgi:lysophospholipase L1-like esterase
MAAVGSIHGVRAWRKSPPVSRRLAWSGVVALWLAWIIMLVDWGLAVRCGRPFALKAARPIVCLGDSLSAWPTAREGYPQVLGELVSVPVVNLARPGITSRAALEILPLLEQANPQIVVVELGGNDFVEGDERAAVKANLEAIITACRGMGAEVVLVEIPRGLVWDPFGGLERNLARKHDLELVADTPIRNLVLWSPSGPLGMLGGPQSYLSNDGLHPNARGNRHLAQYVADALIRLAAPEIRADH